MANNRMALVCKHCGVGIAIAKYYPLGGFIGGEDTKDNAGWYANGDLHKRIDEFFVRHNHGKDNTMSGEDQYYLGYEDDGKYWKYEKLAEQLPINQSKK